MEGNVHLRVPLNDWAQNAQFLRLCPSLPGLEATCPGHTCRSHCAAHRLRTRAWRNRRLAPPRAGGGGGRETRRGGADARERGVRAAAAASPACGTCPCLRPSWSRYVSSRMATLWRYCRLRAQETRPFVRPASGCREEEEEGHEIRQGERRRLASSGPRPPTRLAGPAPPAPHLRGAQTQPGGLARAARAGAGLVNRPSRTWPCELPAPGTRIVFPASRATKERDWDERCRRASGESGRRAKMAEGARRGWVGGAA